MKQKTADFIVSMVLLGAFWSSFCFLMRELYRGDIIGVAIMLAVITFFSGLLLEWFTAKK